ncbi:MAG TPA: aa3-type cytochrome c oxidase subunit IV [Stellaceae bacterium]|nr:aa3-type cytochrome c oxidase subunit IV [Stellaceae bacterium]
MAVDQELERHRQTWISFTRLMKWSIVLVIVVVVIMLREVTH